MSSSSPARPLGARLASLSSRLPAPARAAAALLGVRILGLACAFATTWLLARALAPAHYAAFAVAVSIATLGAILGSANLGAVAIRFHPAYLERARSASPSISVAGQAGAAGYRATLGHAVVICSVACASMLALGYLLLIRSGAPSVTVLGAMAGVAALPLFAYLRTGAALGHAAGAGVRAWVPSMLVRPAALLVGVLILLQGSGGAPGQGAVLALLVASAALACAVQRASSARSAGRDAAHAAVSPEPPASFADRRAWLRASLALLVPTLFLECTLDLAVLVASLVLPDADTAVVALVLRLQGLMLFGVASVNMAYAPGIARAHARRDAVALRHLLRSSAHLKLWPTLLLGAALVPLAGSLLALFGAHYAPYAHTLLIASATPLVLALSGPTVLLVTLAGIERRAAGAFALALGTLVGLGAALGTAFGPTGVVASVLVAWALWSVSLAHLVQVRTGIRASPFVPRVRGAPSSIVFDQAPSGQRDGG